MTQKLTQRHAGISLRELLPESQFFGASDVRVHSCSGNWHECQPKDLYVAIVGNETDGHDHVEDAIGKGAQAILSERLLAIDQPQCVVDDSRTAYGAICHALAGEPSQQLTTIGVSGTFGKTITSHLIQSILTTAGHNPGAATSLETSFADHLVTETAVKMTPPGLAQTLSSMVLGSCSHAIVEAPSTALAQHRMSGTQLDVAVLTNIRHERLAFHGTKTNYRKAKTRLLDYLKPTGFAVLNADDRNTHFLLDQIDMPTLTVGMRHAAEITAKLIDRHRSEQTFLLTAGNENAIVRTSMIGDHHIYNCLSATAVALTLGIDLPTIVRGLEIVTYLPGRMERVECGQPFGVFVDTALAPFQVATALHSLKDVTPGKVICVLSTDDHLTAIERSAFGRAVEANSHRCYLTSNAVEPTINYEPFHQILDGCRHPKRPHLIPNRIDAIEYALSQAQADDSILIAGTGDRPIAMLGEKNWKVTDRDVCQAWLFESSKNDAEMEKPNIFRFEDYRKNE